MGDLLLPVFSQNIGINTSGGAANSSAILDLNTGNTFTSPNGKGLLIPNIALTGVNDAATIASPATSLMVYVPTGSGLSPAGYYYNSGTPGAPVWSSMGGGASISGSGTLNYYARWTPNGTTLGVGFTEDNGTSISMSNPASAPINANMLTVTGNSTSVNAILGQVTGVNAANGVEGLVTTTGGSGGNGVLGSIGGSGGGNQYGVNGTSTVTAGNGYGVVGSATGSGATNNYGGYFSASGATNNYGVIVPSAGGLSGFYTNIPVNTVDDYGSLGTQISSALVTGAVTLDATYHTVLANPTGGSFTITLPGGAASNIRREYRIVFAPSAATTNVVTITPSSGSIIFGATTVTSFTLNGGSILLQSNGGNWYVTQNSDLDYYVEAYTVNGLASGNAGCFSANTAAMQTVTSITIVNAGTYIITASCEGGSLCTAAPYIELTDGGAYQDVQVAYNGYSYTVPYGWQPYAWAKEETVAANTTFYIKAQETACGSTGYVRNAHIAAIRVH